MLRFKVDVMLLLREAGYKSVRLREEKILGGATMQKLRRHVMVSAHELDVICALLNCQPGDILEWVPDDEPRDLSE